MFTVGLGSLALLTVICHRCKLIGCVMLSGWCGSYGRWLKYDGRPWPCGLCCLSRHPECFGVTVESIEADIHQRAGTVCFTVWCKCVFVAVFYSFFYSA